MPLGSVHCQVAFLFTYTNPATLYVANLQCKRNSYKKKTPISDTAKNIKTLQETEYGCLPSYYAN